MRKNSLRGSLLLLLGSVIWGAAFVAQRVGMDHMGPFSFGAIRMLLAGVVMIPVTCLFERREKTAKEPPARDPKDRSFSSAKAGQEAFYCYFSSRSESFFP